MITYTYTEARQKLASVLEEAAKYGEVRIKRRDGQVFVTLQGEFQSFPA